MSARVIEGQIDAWITEHSASFIGPKEIAEGSDEMLVRCLSYSTYDMSASGWTKVGTARIEITLKGNDQIIAGKVDALQALKTKTLADAQLKVTEIEAQIQTLLAITCEVQS